MWTRVHRDFDIIISMRKWMGLPTDVKPEDLGLPSYCGPKSQKNNLQ